MKAELGEVLQRLYDSEINIATGWSWDGGFEYTLTPEFYLEKIKLDQHTGKTNIIEGYELLIKDVLEAYPNSAFSEWYNAI